MFPRRALLMPRDLSLLSRCRLRWPFLYIPSVLWDQCSFLMRWTPSCLICYGSEKRWFRHGVRLCDLQMEPDGEVIACKNKTLLRQEDEILNSHRSIFTCKAGVRAVMGNHKVLDSWKQLKGFSVCFAWLIISLHMLACASGQPRLIPLL